MSFCAIRSSDSFAFVLVVLAVLLFTPSVEREVHASGGNELDLTISSVAGGIALGGSGTSTASMNFGTVSAFGSLSAGVSRTQTSTNFTVSSPFGIRVNLISGTSPNYFLTAKLQQSDVTNTWQMDSTTLTTSTQTVSNSQSYNSTITYTLFLTVPFSSAPGTISNTVEVRANAN